MENMSANNTDINVEANIGAALPETLPLPIVLILCICGTVIVIQNLLIFLLVYKVKSLRTYTNALVISLAVSDFLYGGAIIPAYIVNTDVDGYLVSIILVASVGNILAITQERYWAVLRPLHYRIYIEKYTWRCIVLVWVLAVTISLVPLTYQSYASEIIDLIYLSVLLIFTALIPLVIVVFVHIVMFLQVRKRNLQFWLPQNNGNGRKLSSAQMNRRTSMSSVTLREWRVAKIFMLIAGFYALAWLPIGLNTLFFIVDRKELMTRELSVISVVTLAIQSMANPCLYCFLKPDFKKSWRKLFKNVNRRGSQDITRIGMVTTSPRPSPRPSFPRCSPPPKEMLSYLTVL